MAEVICGTKTVNYNQKRISWWNDTVKEKVQEKKRAWIRYNQSRTQQTKEEYHQKRNEANEIIKQAKADSCERFGKKIKRKPKKTDNKHQRSKRRSKTTNKEMLRAWKEHYSAKFKEEERIQSLHGGEREEEGNEVEDEEGMTEEEIGMEEVYEALRQ
ncbi:uncharacterized protein [Onthophagus taurus]|uniref:uncharacterized protein n=1 Tax=Onthophagus taurus TaxID=166361 RepID=UPI0039BE29D9